MKYEREDHAGQKKLVWVFGVVVALVAVLVTVVALIVAGGVVQWQEVVGFFDWLSRATAFGAVFAGIAALTAGWLAYHGVRNTIRSAEKREQDTREMTDTRERETARHERFTTIVDQLASDKAAIALGGLFAISALADEWEREALNLMQKLPAPHQWDDHQKKWLEAIQHRAQVIQNIEQQQAVESTPWSKDVIARWKQELVRAEQSIANSRTQYVLTRDTAPPQAKDTVAQRDACLELITAYLRANYGSQETRVTTERTASAEQPEQISSSASRATPKADVDIDPHYDSVARTAAVEIIRTHTVIDALYPWPSQQINLEATHLQHVNLNDVVLQGARLSKVHMEDAHLRQARLQSADLREACLRNADLWSANLRIARLDDANLQGATLNYADLRDADLPGANLRSARMGGANLSDADFGGADLNSADLRGADLRRTRMLDVTMKNAKLQRADLRNASMEDANLQKTTLMDADLREAGLWGVEFQGANLRGAKLAGAKLHSADLSGTDLKFIDLSEADLGTGEEWSLVVLASFSSDLSEIVCADWDETTRWPIDFDAVSVMAEQIRNLQEMHK